MKLEILVWKDSVKIEPVQTEPFVFPDLRRFIAQIFNLFNEPFPSMNFQISRLHHDSP